jgi:hypothetical protein
VNPDQQQHESIERAQAMLRLAREAFSTLELDDVLQRVLEMARELTGAR